MLILVEKISKNTFQEEYMEDHIQGNNLLSFWFIFYFRINLICNKFFRLWSKNRPDIYIFKCRPSFLRDRSWNKHLNTDSYFECITNLNWWIRLDPYVGVYEDLDFKLILATLVVLSFPYSTLFLIRNDRHFAKLAGTLQNWF